jgi:hypothetical protein
MLPVRRRLAEGVSQNLIMPYQKLINIGLFYLFSQEELTPKIFKPSPKHSVAQLDLRVGTNI